MAIAIAEAIGAAHAQGLVHRDLKPENVMRTDAGGDQGARLRPGPRAGAAATGMTPTITQAGALVGTPGYMAPEQIRGLPLDARTDVFAVGVLLYELASGLHPFGRRHEQRRRGADAAGMIAAGDVLARIVAEDPPPLETRSVLPPAAVAVVARALAKSPEARFADGRELAEALRALPAPALTPVPVRHARARRAADRRARTICASRRGGGWRTRPASRRSSRSSWCRPGCCGATSSPSSCAWRCA